MAESLKIMVLFQLVFSIVFCCIILAILSAHILKLERKSSKVHNLSTLSGLQNITLWAKQQETSALTAMTLHSELSSPMTLTSTTTTTLPTQTYTSPTLAQKITSTLSTTQSTSPTLTSGTPTSSTLSNVTDLQILITGGIDTNFKDVILSTETIDILTLNTECESMPSLPFYNFANIAFLKHPNQPTICGGSDSTNIYYTKCLAFTNGSWILTHPLVTPRSDFSVTTQPFGDPSIYAITCGGSKQNGNSTCEILTSKGWKLFNSSLPVNIASHCTTQINTTTVIIMAGVQNTIVSGNTYILNYANKAWVPGPTLITPRRNPACGRILTNKSLGTFGIIATGGFNNVMLDTVELLNHGSSTFTNATPLPATFYYHTLLEDPFGGVIILGGISGLGLIPTIYRLASTEPDDSWVSLPQLAPTDSYLFSSILIPYSLFNCSA